MEFDDFLAPVHGVFNVEEALAGWRWLVPQPLKALVMTAAGDLFLRDESGTVFFLDTVEGRCEEVAASVDEWQEKLDDEELFNQWFLPGLIADLRESKPLAHGQCYSPMHAPVLGGSFDAANWQPVDWLVHLSHSGRLHEAIKDLPPGTKITGIHYTEL